MIVKGKKAHFIAVDSATDAEARSEQEECCTAGLQKRTFSPDLLTDLYLGDGGLIAGVFSFRVDDSSSIYEDLKIANITSPLVICKADAALVDGTVTPSTLGG